MLQDSLEKEMKINAMEDYPQVYKIQEPSTDPTIMGLQNQISTLIESLKYLPLNHLEILHMLCTHCQVEGNHVVMCL